MGAEYLDVAFDEQRRGDVDFDDITLFANYRFKTSEMSTLAVLTTFEKFDPVDDDPTDYYSLSGEWTRNWTETAKVYVRAGASFVDSNSTAGGGNNSTSSGFSGGVGAEWTYQVTRLFADLNQYLDPNADGQLVNRTQLRLGVARDLSQKTVLTFGLRGINDDAPPGDSTFVSQKYFAGDVGFRWRMQRQWTLFGGYTYRWKDRDDAADNATANALSLGVAWQPDRK
ncbi:MAG: outer membrane beta-barrel protein [Proteobacteria bacterium]|nr:outer membrane beta-barrel protein [Pseudomonadota bacterium]